MAHQQIPHLQSHHHWWVVVSGPEDWFPQFAWRFRSPDFEVGFESWEVAGRQEAGYCFATARLNRIAEMEEARPVAHSETRTLSGLARLLWEGIPPVKAKLLIRVEDRRFVEGAILAVPRMAILQGGSPMGIENDILVSDRNGEVIKAEVVAALEEPRAQQALEIYGREQPSWGSLFKVYELLRDRFGDEQLCATGLINQAQLKSFRSTANLPALSGIDARHATKAGDAPAPMRLSDAHALFRKLLAVWLSGGIEQPA